MFFVGELVSVLVYFFGEMCLACFICVCVCLICLSLKSLFRVHFVGLFFWVLVPLALQRRLFTVMGG